MTRSNTISNALLGGFLTVAGCSGADEPTPAPDTGASTQPAPVDVRGQATSALERDIAELAQRLASGEEAAESHSLDVQAAWSVSLRELRRRLRKIETRFARLPETGDEGWRDEVKQIRADADVLERQLEAELASLSRLR